MTTRMISQKAVVEIWISRLRSRQPAAPHRLARKSGRPKSTSLATPPACIPSHPWAFGWMECTYFIITYYNILLFLLVYFYFMCACGFCLRRFRLFFLQIKKYILYLQRHNSYFHPPQYHHSSSSCSSTAHPMSSRSDYNKIIPRVPVGDVDEKTRACKHPK